MIEYEAELNNDQFPYYIDTIHRVSVLAYNPRKQQYKCRLLAFDTNTDDWYNKEQIHPVTDSTEMPKNFEINESVLVKIPNRKINNECVDGKADTIWVKAIIKIKWDHHYTVQYRNWEQGGYIIRRVHKNNVRQVYLH